jgi:hypothetical protein
MILYRSILSLTGLEKATRINAAGNFQTSIEIEINEKELQYIPKNGGVVTVSNRPVGIVEELILKKLIEPIRNDIAFLHNNYLTETNAIENRYFENHGLLELKNIATSGKIACIFPVGNISEFQTPQLSFTDSKWDKVIVKELHECSAPIIPIYISVHQDNTSKLLGMMHPALKVRKLLNEWNNNQTLKVKVRIGKPIDTNKLSLENPNQFGRFLRAKVYSLGSALEIEKFYPDALTEEKIVEAPGHHLIVEEIESLRELNKIGEQGDFEVFLAKAKKIPNVIQEIGRLREITFRNIGEGTLLSTDLDEYDLHYLHLFLWDRKNEKIAGAYRIGSGDYIMKSMGKKGFYLRSLFKISDEMNPILEKSVELGRSFVADEYQKQPSTQIHNRTGKYKQYLFKCFEKPYGGLYKKILLERKSSTIHSASQKLQTRFQRS